MEEVLDVINMQKHERHLKRKFLTLRKHRMHESNVKYFGSVEPKPGSSS